MAANPALGGGGEPATPRAFAVFGNSRMKSTDEPYQSSANSY